ncbi:MAG: DUF3552 domain-containing protein [Candidatus Niyogibacteria bacterium]|nr:DUF3552 domain-containing protein [Candidatus Niyogibacteria bacterium]
MTSTLLVVAVVSILAGIAGGYLLRQIIARQKRDSIELDVKQILLDAKTEARQTLDEAKKKAESVTESAKRDERERESQIRKLEERIIQKEELVEKRRLDVDKERESLQAKANKIKQIEKELGDLEESKR